MTASARASAAATTCGFTRARRTAASFSFASRARRAFEAAAAAADARAAFAAAASSLAARAAASNAASARFNLPATATCARLVVVASAMSFWSVSAWCDGSIGWRHRSHAPTLTPASCACAPTGFIPPPTPWNAPTLRHRAPSGLRGGVERRRARLERGLVHRRAAAGVFTPPHLVVRGADRGRRGLLLRVPRRGRRAQRRGGRRAGPQRRGERGRRARLLRFRAFEPRLNLLAPRRARRLRRVASALRPSHVIPPRLRVRAQRRRPLPRFRDFLSRELLRARPRVRLHELPERGFQRRVVGVEQRGDGVLPCSREARAKGKESTGVIDGESGLTVERDATCDARAQVSVHRDLRHSAVRHRSLLVAYAVPQGYQLRPRHLALDPEGLAVNVALDADARGLSVVVDDVRLRERLPAPAFDADVGVAGQRPRGRHHERGLARAVAVAAAVVSVIPDDDAHAAVTQRVRHRVGKRAEAFHLDLLKRDPNALAFPPRGRQRRRAGAVDVALRDAHCDLREDGAAFRGDVGRETHSLRVRVVEPDGAELLRFGDPRRGSLRLVRHFHVDPLRARALDARHGRRGARARRKRARIG
eukprot:29182-Pelagococcus_subviridis.AAC.5